MNWIDIVVFIVAAIALYRGYTKGLVAELCGLIGVLLGSYLAYEYNSEVIELLGIDSEYATYIAFAIILVVVVVGINFVARLSSRVLEATGLGIINNLLGAGVSLLKAALILSLLFITIESVGGSSKSLKESKTFKPVIGIGNIFFPYIVAFASECSDVVTDHISELTSKDKE